MVDKTVQKLEQNTMEFIDLLQEPTNEPKEKKQNCCRS